MTLDTRDVMRLQSGLQEANTKYLDRLDEFLTIDPTDKGKRKHQFRATHRALTAFINQCDAAAAISSDTGNNPSWLRFLTESCESVLIHILDFRDFAIKYCPELEEPLPSLSGPEYGSMQRLLKREQPARAEELRKRFIAAGLPTRGFDEDLPPRPSRNEATVKYTKDGMEVTGLRPGEAARVASSYANATIDNAQVFGGIAQNAPQTIEALPSTSKRGGYLSLVIKGALAIGATVAAAFVLAALGSRGCAPEAVFPSPTSASSSVAPPAATSSH